MKIVNICNKSFIDGWGYQENLLPEYEVKAGCEVVVIGSSNHFLSYVEEKKREEIRNRGNDYFYEGIHIIRRKTFVETQYLSFICTGIYRVLKKEKPNIIFVHNINSSSLVISMMYSLMHRECKLFVDNHEDILNASNNIVWNYLIKKGLLRFICVLGSGIVQSFYGVTPARCDYLHTVFGVQLDKIKLLPLGGDTDKVDLIKDGKTSLREKYSISFNSFVLCCGGKLSKWKGINNLITAFENLRKNNRVIVLVLFGKFEDEETEELIRKTEGVVVFDWLDRISTLEMLKLSDVAIWPLHHTTLIDDAVACSTPIIVRRTGNTGHLIDNNGVFLEKGTVEEIQQAIQQLMDNYDDYKQASSVMKDRYSYRNIVRQLLNDYYSSIN